jgi:hypothetical protein
MYPPSLIPQTGKHTPFLADAVATGARLPQVKHQPLLLSSKYDESCPVMFIADRQDAGIYLHDASK